MKMLDAVHAEVRDRERAVLEILLRQLGLARRAGRARLARLRSGRATCARHSRMTGTMRPRSVATASPTFAFGKIRISSSANCAFTSRCRSSAIADELRQDVGDGHLLVAQPLAEGQRARHVGGHRDLEGGCFPGLRQAAARSCCRIEVSGTTSASSGAAPTVAWAGVGGGALDVLGDDAALRARAGEALQVDAALAGDAAGERRGLDAAVDPRGCASAAGSSSAAASRPRSRSSSRACAGRAFLLRVLVDFDLGLGLRVGDVLALLADDRDPLADLDLLTLAGEDLEQHAARLGLDLLGHLVGVELVERLALLDLVALGLQPADDRPGLHALAEPRKADVNRHCVPRCA